MEKGAQRDDSVGRGLRKEKGRQKIEERGSLRTASALQWRRQLWGTGARVSPSTFNDLIFSSLWSKSKSQLSKYRVVCEIS